MNYHKLEIHVPPYSRQAICFICSPKFGDAGDLPTANLKQTLVLNDGANRVTVGVYGHAQPLEWIKSVARIAVDRTYER